MISLSASGDAIAVGRRTLFSESCLLGIDASSYSVNAVRGPFTALASKVVLQ